MADRRRCKFVHYTFEKNFQFFRQIILCGNFVLGHTFVPLEEEWNESISLEQSVKVIASPSTPARHSIRPTKPPNVFRGFLGFSWKSQFEFWFWMIEKYSICAWWHALCDSLHFKIFILLKTINFKFQSNHGVYRSHQWQPNGFPIRLVPLSTQTLHRQVPVWYRNTSINHLDITAIRTSEFCDGKVVPVDITVRHRCDSFR